MRVLFFLPFLSTWFMSNIWSLSMPLLALRTALHRCIFTLECCAVRVNHFAALSLAVLLRLYSLDRHSNSQSLFSFQRYETHLHVMGSTLKALRQTHRKIACTSSFFNLSQGRCTCRCFPCSFPRTLFRSVYRHCSTLPNKMRVRILNLLNFSSRHFSWLYAAFFATSWAKLLLSLFFSFGVKGGVHCGFRRVTHFKHGRVHFRLSVSSTCIHRICWGASFADFFMSLLLSRRPYTELFECVSAFFNCRISLWVTHKNMKTSPALSCSNFLRCITPQ
jgi:hypothetical protein